MKPNDVFKVTASRNLDHDHRDIISLLYIPMIGAQASALYFTLYALIDRAKLRTATHPHSFLFDLIGLTPQAFNEARKKLEATGLMDTLKSEEDTLYELYLPMSADTFIKDSPFAPYVLKELGEARFDDLIAHFKITRIHRTQYDNITASFDEVFSPAYEHIKTRATYLEAKQRPVEFHHDFDPELLIESIPDAMIHPTTKTKRVKARLKEIAYIFDLDETAMKSIILKSLKDDMAIDFDALIKAAQKNAQAKPAEQYTRKTSGYDLDYFKQVHPKNLMEDLTGMHVPAADLRVLEQIITKTDLKLEVINVLIAYVIKELKGQFPVYGYFEKVVAEWKRNGITKAEDAIHYIKDKRARRTQAQKPRVKSKKELPVDVEVDWFEDYLKKMNEEGKS